MHILTWIIRITVALVMSLASVGVLAQEATPGVIGDAASHECMTDLGTSEVPEGASGYVIDGSSSEASFTVTEELAGRGVTEAVGTTQAIIGTILIAEDGTPIPCSRFDVDLRTLVTDESRRDGQIQKALETDAFPVATFILTDVRGHDGALKEGEETELELVGNLSVHGVEKQVVWQATVTLEGDSVTGSAETLIHFGDFEITKPVIGPVMSIEDTVTLRISLNAANAG